MVYRFEREALAGFLDAGNPIEDDWVNLLTPEGTLQKVALETVKTICFVRDWGEGKPWQRGHYTVRPRQQGLWVRLLFRDGESVEATMANSLQLLDPVVLLVAPPDAGNAAQKVLVPRAALEGFEVLGVIGSPLKRPAKAKVAPNQLKMFD